MAKLKIYNEITDESTKTFFELFGDSAVCFKDVNDFIGSIPNDDNDIDVYLHCPGGNCVEGFAIYDALRASGKRVTTIVDGMCASMATIIMLAAPKERRFAKPNSSFLIHNPMYQEFFAHAAIADEEELSRIQKTIQIQMDCLKETRERIINVYVERTGSDADTLQAIMDENRWMYAEEAKSLGFIGEILQPNTDKAMAKDFKMIDLSALRKVLAQIGVISMDDKVITTATGDDLSVDCDDAPQVGDAASPDGEHVMDDGSTIVVEDGVVSDVIEQEDCVETLKQQIADLEANQKTEEDIQNLSRITELEANQKTEEDIQNLSRIPELESSIANLTAQVEALQNSAITSEDAEILQRVKNVAGEIGVKAWLDLVTNTSSSFVPHDKSFKENHVVETPSALGESFLQEKRKRKGILI